MIKQSAEYHEVTKTEMSGQRQFGVTIEHMQQSTETHVGLIS